MACCGGGLAGAGAGGTRVPACRVAYLDNDPVVLTRARALLRSSAGGVIFLDADIGQTETVIAGAGSLLDFSQPVAVIMIGVLNFLAEAGDVLARLVEPGIVEVNRWRPAPGDPGADVAPPLLGAVARKP